MFLPEPMSRILVVGTKDKLPATVNLLYSLEKVHVIDFSPETEGFTLGAPLPEASDASHKLLKLRSAEKDLDIVPVKGGECMPVSKVKADLGSTVAEIESDVQSVAESKNTRQGQLNEMEGRLAALRPYRSIPLDLEAYRGYSCLSVITGNVHSDPEPGLRDALNGEYELFTTEDGTFIALFVPIAMAEEAQRVLAQYGFSQTAVPDGTGNPREVASKLEADISCARKDLEETEQKLSELREKHAAAILASDEYLSIEVEKAELPIRMGASAHSFILEAWVPTRSFDDICKAFSDSFGDSIHIEVLENKERKHHEEPAEEHEDVGMFATDEGNEPASEEAPVSLKHGKLAGRFTYFTNLYSTPSYNEIDPTILLSIFFPLFFGFMVGDVGYAIPFIILGALGLKMCVSKDWRAIATMLFYGGLWSAFFGLFLFGDMMGIEFTNVHSGGSEGMWSVTWAELLGIDIPHTLFTIGGFDVNLGYVTKLGNVTLLLYATLWVGLAHLIFGLILGMYNIAIRHGIKHAIMEKGSWLMIFLGFACLLPVIIDVFISGHDLIITENIGFLLGIGLFIAGLVLAVVGEGGIVLMEIPEVLSNVISYARLAAIGMSKAGMALAFNYMSIGMLAAGVGGAASATDVLILIAALAIFVVGHLMIFIMAIISAGIHGIRLQYVEFFKKFYTGGGLEFNPLKINRKYTVEE